MRSGKNVMTQKFVQTGSEDGYSYDIDIHRHLMGLPMTEDDQEFITSPVILQYPASPHLSASLMGCEINLAEIKNATDYLSKKYDIVLVEGAGGLMVPLTEDYLTIDYIAEHRYPLIFVTSGRLGSINHTLLSFEAIRTRGLKLHAVLYNLYPPVDDATIQDDTYRYIGRYLAKHFPEAEYLTVPIIA
jgi:dethiobiotin synthetase